MCFVDFVRRNTSEYKCRHGTTKYILKKALEGVLPENILHRPKKGFCSPIGLWFKNGTLAIDDSALPGFKRGFIQRKNADHRAGRSDERAFLWNVYVLNQWAKTG